MNQELWRKANQLFHEASNLPPEVWTPFLERHCSGDDALRNLVENLLDKALHMDDGFLEPSHRDRLIKNLHQDSQEPISISFEQEKAPKAWVASPPGTYHDLHPKPWNFKESKSQRFQLQEMLGEGGMGVVYKAIQKLPVRRTVAIKILKHSLSETMRYRFQTEAQSLSLLSQHPYIATLFEADTTSDGCPFFAMEFIPGQPLTAFCDQEHLNITNRLKLFIKTCKGVSHAHVNGIIHRDLKPSNILVHQQNDQVTPKIIDFGIAKIMDPGSNPSLRITSSHMFLGTPQYMSPEQATLSKSVDTRSDVYALGVMLYELLCGASPYDFTQAEKDPNSIRDIIAIYPPIPLKKRLMGDHASIAEIAANRSTTPSSLIRMSNQGLSWIIFKALAKDPAKRYQSVAELAADIGRFLDDKPVLAHAPSVWYHFRVFARRHRISIIPIALGIAFILINLVNTHFSLARSRVLAKKLDLALEKEKTLTKSYEDVAGYLGQVLNKTDPHALGPNAPILKALEMAEPYLHTRSPGAQIQIRNLATRGYLTLYDQDKAQYQLRLATSLGMMRLGAEHPATLEALQLQVFLDLQVTGDYAKALADLKDLEAYQKELPDLHRVYFENLTKQARLLTQMERYEESQELYRDLIAQAKKHSEGASPELLALQSGLALPMYRGGQQEQAITLLEDTLLQQKKLLGQRDPMLLATQNNYALILRDKGETTKARHLFEEVLGKRKDILGNDHLDTAATKRRLALLYKAQDEMDRALQLMEEVLAFYHRKFPKNNVHDPLYNSYGGMLTKSGQFSKALQIFKKLVALRSNRYGPHAKQTLRAKNNVADVLIHMNELEQAEGLVQEVLERRMLQSGPFSKGIAFSLFTLGEIRQKQGLDASGFFCDAWQAAARTPTSAIRIAEFQGQYGEALMDQGVFHQAYVTLTGSLDRFPDPTDAKALKVQRILEELYVLWVCDP